MSTAFWLNSFPTEVPANTVRSTVDVVDNDAPSATMPHAPDRNETLTDYDTGAGLTTHTLSSHVVPSERYVPTTGNANADFTQVGKTISQVGTAASREKAGQWGHGTLRIVEGIEPTLPDVPPFGDEIFAAERQGIQTDSGAYMTQAVASDPDSIAQTAYTGVVDSRDAAAAAMYSAFAAFQTGIS